MDQPDKLFLSIKDNPELAAVFANKQPGDKCKLEVEVQVDEKTDKMVSCSIDSASPIEYSEEDDAKEVSESPEPDGESVVLAVMNGKKKKGADTEEA